jgi:hypothetical protein
MVVDKENVKDMIGAIEKPYLAKREELWSEENS